MRGSVVCIVMGHVGGLFANKGHTDPYSLVLALSPPQGIAQTSSSWWCECSDLSNSLWFLDQLWARAGGSSFGRLGVLETGLFFLQRIPNHLGATGSLHAWDLTICSLLQLALALTIVMADV